MSQSTEAAAEKYRILSDQSEHPDLNFPVRDVALAVGIHPDALRGRVDRGTIPSKRVHGRRTVSVADVAAAYDVFISPERAEEIMRDLRDDSRGPVQSNQPLDPTFAPPQTDEVDLGGAGEIQEISKDAAALMAKRGLDPEDWVVDAADASEWQGPVSGGVHAFQRLRIKVKRRHPEYSLVPARSDGWVAPKVAKRRTTWESPELVVIASDQQAPFHNPVLHDLFCAWLDENRPDRGVINGDLVDLPDISRHRNNPQRQAIVNECTQAGYDVARGYVESSPDTSWDFIPGNHDERIRNFTLDWAPELHDVKRARRWEDDEDEDSVLAVEYLMRFDELGIKVADPDGPYARAFVKLSPYLAVRHGWLVAKGAGASALKTLEHLGYSVITGHTHRLAIVHGTKHDIDQNPETLQSVEGGCMCVIDDKPIHHRGEVSFGANYTPAPDWQNGFTTATIWPDGTFKVDVATYFDGTLLWRDQRFT